MCKSRKRSRRAQSTLNQVEAKRKAIDDLLVEKKAAKKQAAAYTLHRGELIDRIRDVERMLETVAKNKSSSDR